MLTARTRLARHRSQMLVNSTDWQFSSLHVIVTLLWMFLLSQSVGSCPDVCHCSWSRNHELLVDCSGQDLTVLPRNLPINMTSLNLSGNHIEVLYNYTFTGLLRLSRLDLSYNRLSTIYSKSFQGLTTLKNLNLRSNPLCFVEIICYSRPNVFEPLFHLEVLDISDNYMELKAVYPKQIWMYLPNLKELHLGTLPAKFNGGFLNLKNLQTLSLSDVGKVNTKNINNDTFEGLRLSPIKNLDLGGSNIVDFDGQAFQYLPSLVWLSVANNPLGALALANMVSGFSLISLRHLDLNGTMQQGEIHFLWDGCNWASRLTSLTVSNNLIDLLGTMMSQCLPKIEVFSCSHNNIFEYIENVVWLLNLPNIRVLDMSWQKHTTKPYDMMSQAGGVFEVSNITDSPRNFSLSMAPTLEDLDISHNHLPHIPAITLVTHVNLRILRAVNAGISNITKSIFCQYTPRIHEIDVRNNSINLINQDVFTKCNWMSITKLRMSGNMLADLGPKPFFVSFPGLVELDLSHNDIPYLHPKTFANNTALQILKLSHNHIVDFRANLSHLTSLQFLDVSHNLIARLTTITIKEFDVLAQLNPNLTIDLTDNPLHCSCDWLPALGWMAKNPQHFKGIEEYQCTFNKFITITFSHLDVILQQLNSECRSLHWLYIPILASLPAVSIVVAISLVFRWHFMLEVSWYKPRSVEDEIEYEFDSFVVYNKQDKNWVQNQLCRNLELNNPPGSEDLPASRDTDSYKLCCHHRDFIIGMHIIDNITDAFDKSRTTLIVMSNAALCGNWWQLELQMAVQTAVARRTSSLLFVFLEPLEGRLVTPQLRRILNTYTCKRWYPGDLQKQQELWRDLKIAMKFPRRNGLTMERQARKTPE